MAFSVWIFRATGGLTGWELELPCEVVAGSCEFAGMGIMIRSTRKTRSMSTPLGVVVAARRERRGLIIRQIMYPSIRTRFKLNLAYLQSLQPIALTNN